jgi:hypothetical protein
MLHIEINYSELRKREVDAASEKVMNLSWENNEGR